MTLKILGRVAIFLVTTTVFCQNEYSITNIPAPLLENANSVLRSEDIKITVDRIDKVVIEQTRAVTVMNKYGDGHAFAADQYDKATRIKNQKLTIYDAFGNEVREYKEKDFTDASNSGSNLFTDNRISYLDYTPNSYPYTAVYKSEIIQESSVFIPSWSPVRGYGESVEKASFILENPGNVILRKKEINLGKTVENTSKGQNASYFISNVPAYKYEELSPAFNEIRPIVRFALNNFSLVGTQGTGSNWNEFGKWQYQNFLSNVTEVPAQTIAEISNLTKGTSDKMEKARIIYEYVQNKTRYISVQLGIGGWKPMTATEVDQLGYGDCKALTNYTRALLATQNIESFYSVVWGDTDKRDLDPEFASMQGNHVILNIPNKEENVWLECTSQTLPFNYLGDFTDDRNVLVIKPEGGEIVHTKTYAFDENREYSVSKIIVDTTRDFIANINRSATGICYGDHYSHPSLSSDEKEQYYKNIYSHLKNIELEGLMYEDNKKDQKFSESYTISGKNIGNPAGNRILLPLTVIKFDTPETPRYQKRINDLEIPRGFVLTDESEVILPQNYEIEALPDSKTLENEFGSYTIVVENIDPNIIKVKREFTLKDGRWSAENYNDFREFMNKVRINNNLKAVLVSKS